MLKQISEYPANELKYIYMKSYYYKLSQQQGQPEFQREEEKGICGHL